jgi:hypothetical protein
MIPIHRRTRSPSSKAPAVPLYSVTYQGIRIGSVAREPRRTHWVALSIIDNQAAKFATRKDASEWLKRRWIEERERAETQDLDVAWRELALAKAEAQACRP